MCLSSNILPKLSIMGLMVLMTSAASAAETPERIVSTNLCTDQIVMQLVEPEHIVSVSYLAADPVSSNMPEQAKAIGLNRAIAEEIIVSNPDLIIVGSFSASHTSRILETLGYRVERFAPATGIETAKANILRIGDLVEEREKASAMITQIDGAITQAQSRIRPGDPELVYANYALNGFTSGDGTLMADLVRIAGFTPLAEKLGKSGMPQLSAEHLIVAKPDVIDLSGNDYKTPSRSTEAMQHPALASLTAQTHKVSIPAAQTACGTTHMLAALKQLSDTRLQILEMRRQSDS